MTLQHLALIMDGNRRWAKKQGWQAYQGHSQGVESVKRVVEFCLKKNIPYLSLYTFSLENFKRSPTEQTYLFELLVQETTKGLPTFKEQGIRIKFIGDRTLFPDSITEAIVTVEQATQEGKKLHLSLLFCYGSRQEIINSVKQIIAHVQAGLVREEEISETLFESYLWTYGIPEPDLIIRTSGHQRLSNFLLYQAAYSELYFIDCLWPELQIHHLEEAVERFEECQRNFGT
jgi:undecaprenyl diphosphate synthase